MREVAAWTRWRLASMFGLAVLLSACGGQSGSSGNAPVPSVSQVQGQVQGWDASTYTHMEAYIGVGGSPSHYGRVNVDAQGRFTYNLPTPDSRDLSSQERITDDYAYGCTITRRPTISSQNSQLALLSFSAVHNQGWRREVVLADASDGRRGVYVYFTNAMSIQGMLEANCQGGVLRINYDVRAPQGWSYLELYIAEVTQSTIRLEVSSKPSPSQGVAWRIP